MSFNVFVCTVPERLTTSNQILLAVGVVLLCVAIAIDVCIVILRMHIKGENTCRIDFFLGCNGAERDKSFMYKYTNMHTHYFLEQAP